MREMLIKNQEQPHDFARRKSSARTVFESRRTLCKIVAIIHRKDALRVCALQNGVNTADKVKNPQAFPSGVPSSAQIPQALHRNSRRLSHDSW